MSRLTDSRHANSLISGVALLRLWEVLYRSLFSSENYSFIIEINLTMYNRPSSDNGRGRRPTLPSIRDLFSGEFNNLI